MIFSSGIESLKLYYMIGLPTETDEDLVAIRDLTLQLKSLMLKHARGRGRIGSIVGSVNPLVPKPGTAYQWLPMEEQKSISRKIKRMRTLINGIDNVYLNIKSERHSFYQALLYLGDRRVAAAIEAANAWLTGAPPIITGISSSWRLISSMINFMKGIVVVSKADNPITSALTSRAVAIMSSALVLPPKSITLKP